MASASWERMIFYKDQWSTYVVALVASAHQSCRIVPLLQPFVKRFAIKICTAIDKEKARSSYVHHECTNVSAHT